MTREKLEALFARRWPELDCVNDAQKLARLFRLSKFHALLDIGTNEAFLAAAMMCVPEGWRIDLRIYPSGYTEIDLSHDTLSRSLGLDAHAPAEALIEAIEKAMNDE